MSYFILAQTSYRGCGNAGVTLVAVAGFAYLAWRLYRQTPPHEKLPLMFWAWIVLVALLAWSGMSQIVQPESRC